MQFAVKKNNFITNIIIADLAQQYELEQALCAEFINLAECKVSIGDMWDGTNWTRNVNGEQVIVDTTPTHEESTEARVASIETSLASLTETVDVLVMESLMA